MSFPAFAAVSASPRTQRDSTEVSDQITIAVWHSSIIRSIVRWKSSPANQVAVPPHHIALFFQKIRDTFRFRPIVACIADENVDHLPLPGM